MKLVKLSEEDIQLAIIEYIMKNYKVEDVKPYALVVPSVSLVKVESIYEVRGSMDR